MSLDLTAFHVTDVAVAAGLSSVQMGSQLLNFNNITPSRLGKYAALVWNPLVPLQIPLPPRAEILSEAVGGRVVFHYLGRALLSGGQNVSGRRPLAFEVNLIASNQNLLAGTGWDFYPRGLVSIQLEVSELQSWQLLYMEYD